MISVRISVSIPRITLWEGAGSFGFESQPETSKSKGIAIWTCFPRGTSSAWDSRLEDMSVSRLLCVYFYFLHDRPVLPLLPLGSSHPLFEESLPQSMPRHPSTEHSRSPWRILTGMGFQCSHTQCSMRRSLLRVQASPGLNRHCLAACVCWKMGLEPAGKPPWERRHMSSDRRIVRLQTWKRQALGSLWWDSRRKQQAFSDHPGISWTNIPNSVKIKSKCPSEIK